MQPLKIKIKSPTKTEDVSTPVPIKVKMVKVSEKVEVPKPVPSSPSPYEKFSKCNQPITITYSECAENHVGMQKIGKLANRGLSLAKLKEIEAHFQTLGCVTELTLLAEQAGVSDIVGADANSASVLVVRGGAAALLAGESVDDLYHEQSALNQDTKAKMYGRVVNKHARYNLCFDDEAQEPKARDALWPSVMCH